ncbi:helix-turn-helix domain-containing protein [Pontibacillus sp. ALD_SL1]|uniref:helix-turn-helix domain-containing protein n=1 Tax=Pontibacillus sp. ALD_SL1 TaxID=2777185 RepID=UPI001A975417|nr:RodZ family helix-turn-helix domain-containing protein [Pontibacillus sp. ALD_SL1]QST01651.1 helix-turn-helix domain-containing protein [Pontibacillus sp. ALD_SL1]
MEIGARLKEARESQNMTLDDVQQETKIQTRYLQAIEKGNFSIMPGKFYTRAFIRQYAEAVGLDPESLMEEHKSELPSSSEEEYIQYTRLQRQKDESPSGRNSAFMSFLPKLTIILLIVGILVVALVFYQKTMGSSNNNDNPTQQSDEPVDTYERSESNGNSPEDDDKVSSDQPDSNEKEESDDSSNDQSKEDESNESNQKEDNQEDETKEEPKKQLVLKEKGESTQNGVTPISVYELQNAEELKITFSTVNGSTSYVDIKDASGKIIFMENAIKDGQEVDLKNQKEVTINIGRTPGVSLKVNGESLKYPISPDEQDVQKIRIIKASAE